MSGAIYVVVCVFFGLSAGCVGRIKGSSFWIWFLIGAVLPGLGVLCALVYRFENDELRRQCPTCGRVAPLYAALCTRCGAELEFPETAIEPERAAAARG